MGPDKNPELFETVGEERIDSLHHEFIRRTLLAATLKDLSELFDAKDHTSHPVTEPTLLGRLVALSRVQRTPMGIAGFNPLESVDFDGSVSAKAAPHHDEFITGNDNPIRTRIIKLTLPGEQYGDSDVEVFGLNIYQPDANTEISFDEPEDRPSAKTLVIVGQLGEVKTETVPITGETVVFAVRNKTTQDAKFYKVSFVDEADGDLMPADGISHSGNRTTTTLPDKKVAAVELLHGKLQEQMVSELNSSIEKFKALETVELTELEQRAARGLGVTLPELDAAEIDDGADSEAETEPEAG